MIAQDTVKRSKSIIAEHASEGATIDSTFYPDQLAVLEPLNTPKEKHLIQILNSDAFTAARKLLDEHPNARGSVAVLNLASDAHPGGGWLSSLSRTQAS